MPVNGYDVAKVIHPQVYIRCGCRQDGETENKAEKGDDTCYGTETDR